jgi:ATP-dependent Lhr-like helicase
MIDDEEAALHPALCGWALDQGWQRFSDVQLASFKAILTSSNDVIISAATAAGKTEAAFLPLLTQAASRQKGVSVLCISPRKALINDQDRRLERPAKQVGVPLRKWHGEASKTGKTALFNNPLGVVLMTPESLEGRLICQPTKMKRVFGNLDAILIDEFHDFLEGPRGLQLASLLARLDDLCGQRARRIALSATLGDLRYAKNWLAYGDTSSVCVVEEKGSSQKLYSLVRGYENSPSAGAPKGASRLSRLDRPALDQISRVLMDTHTDKTNLVFAGSKRNVETICEIVQRLSHGSLRPSRFYAHHGSLAKKPREKLEERLRRGEALTAVTTATLDLGIDIGTVEAIDQIDAPTSISVFRQRVGRSGRRGKPPAATIHVTEQALGTSLNLLDRLRLNTVRAVAALNLLEKRFVEPPEPEPTMLSVVLQQTLSCVRQRVGATSTELYRLIHSAGPLERLSKGSHKQLLLALCEPELELLRETAQGVFRLGAKGEEILQSNQIYATFQVGPVWDVWSKSERIGSMSYRSPAERGDLFCLNGRRWEIKSIDFRRGRLSVEPALSGRIPFFDTVGNARIHKVVAQEMRDVLGTSDAVPSDCDEMAAGHLLQGRSAFRELQLDTRVAVDDSNDCHLFSWAGSKFNELLAILLRRKGFHCVGNEVSVAVYSAGTAEVVDSLSKGIPTVEELSTKLEALLYGKYDKWIPQELLREDWAKRHHSIEQELVSFCLSLAR